MKNQKAMNILAIGAHPDDIEYGCGGTLIKYKQNGHKVFILVMTCGGEGGDENIRKNEQIESSHIIGTEKVLFGGCRDTKIISNKKLIQKIEDVIADINPDFIFVNYGEDTHQDHRELARATMSATRYIKNVLFFEGPTTYNFHPNIFVNISSVIHKKMTCLEAHSSQIFKTKIEELTIIDMCNSLANFRGVQGRVKNAEGFMPLRLFINI